MQIESHLATLDRVSTQITVRLPDHLVQFLDERVARGEASRAAVVTKALMKYQRRLSAEHDAEIYRTTAEDPSWITWMASRTVPPID